MRNYTLDQNAAREANQNNYISETGKYVGRIVMAEAIKSRNSTDGIELSFQSSAGQTANFLTLYTYNSNGEPLYGLKVLNALMVCAGVQALTQQTRQITDAKDNNRPAQVFIELINKPIGLVLQKEFYEKNDGSGVSYRLNIIAPFHPQTEMMAKEILDGATAPRSLPNILSTLADKPAPKKTQQQTQQYVANGYANASNGGSFPDDPFDDLGGGF